MSSSEDLSKTLGELLVLDIFAKHGFDKVEKRQLSDEQKQEIKRLVENLKTQTETFLKNQATQTTDSNTHSPEALSVVEVPSLSNEDSAQAKSNVKPYVPGTKQRKRTKRLGLPVRKK